MKRWQTSKVYFWETAPFFRLLLPLITSIVLYDSNWLPRVCELTLVSSLCVAMTATIVVLLHTSAIRYMNIARITAVCVSIFLAGWLLCYKNDIRNDPKWFGRQGDAVACEARIIQAPLEREKTWKIKVSVDKAYNKGAVTQTKGTAFVYVYKDGQPVQLKEGDVIMLPHKWTAIKNPGNPNEFDYARFCARQQLYYQQFIARSEISIRAGQVQNLSVIDQTHQMALQALNRHIKDAATLGLMQAMLLGDERNFDGDLRRSYSETGIIHIVAISGGHIIVFFQIISMLFFWLRNKRYEPLKYLIALPLVCFYVAVAGAPTSAVRAAVMFSLVALGMVLQKEKQPLNQLFATGFLMLLYEPMWLFSVGFQLSFAAVLSLLIFYRPVYRLLIVDNRVLKYLWSAAAASIAAEIVVAPIVIYYFHLFPVTFLVANLVAYIFMSVALFIGLAIIGLSSVPVVANILSLLLTFLVKYFNIAIAFFQRLNPASFRFLYLSGIELLLVYLLIAGCALYIMQKQRYGLSIALAATCLLLSSMVYHKWNCLHQQTFVAYNVGKKSYAELISGDRFIAYGKGNTDAATDFATKEFHTASGAWKSGGNIASNALIIGNKTILMLHHPLNADTGAHFPVDYLLIDYPVKGYDALQLRQLFHFNKLIITGEQKRYIATRWKDSCDHYGIPVHFTMFDGAFVLK